jgi:hypothetical protein
VADDEFPRPIQALRNNPIKIITLKEMVDRILPGITKTPPEQTLAAPYSCCVRLE